MKINKKNKSGKTSYIVTKETFGMTLLLFCAIVLLMLFTHDKVFSAIGSAVCTFMYGTFGYGSYLLIALLGYIGETLVFEKKIKITFLRALTVSLTVFFLFLLFHAVTSRSLPLTSFSDYVSACYENAETGFAGYTFGGLISCLFVFPVVKLMGFTAAYVIFALASVAGGYLVFLTFRHKFTRKNASEIAVETAESVQSVPENTAIAEPIAEQPATERREQPRTPVMAAASRNAAAADSKYADKDLGRKILFDNGEFAAESYRRNMIFSESSYFNNVSSVASESDYLSGFASVDKKVPEKSYTETYQNEKLHEEQLQMPLNYVYGEKPAESLQDYGEEQPAPYAAPEPQPAPYIAPEPQQSPYTLSEPQPAQPDCYREERGSARDYDFNARSDFSESMRESADDTQGDGFDEPAESFTERPVARRDSADEDLYNMFEGQAGLGAGRDAGDLRENTDRSGGRERSRAELFDDDEIETDAPVLRRESKPEPENRIDVSDRIRRTSDDGAIVRRESRPITPPTKPEPVPVVEEKPKHVWKKYVRPSIELLDDYPENNNVNTAEIEDNKRIIVDTLANFKIASEISGVTIGPAITRYDVIIEDKTNIKKSLGYRDAIAMELRKENVTAYLNYAKGALSIEVPNNKRTIVGLKGMLASPQFINSKKGALCFGLGKNVEGEVVCPDITKMPHLLVAGTTGSGKSICLSALLVSLLYKYGPDELRLILVDPKQAEFICYDKLPHLMINEILYDVNQVIKALNWAIKEMEHRYALFKEMTEKGIATKSLDEYNAHLTDPADKLPKIVIVLDEFGDLMLQDKKNIESRIIRLVQKARACGIHLILATQRPSVDCITGLIKSNLPTRIGFKVNSFDDARTIFDIGGAEKLLGMGDMYYRSAAKPELTRIQGCFIDTPEVQRVTDFIKANNETYFDQAVSDFINAVEEPAESAGVGSAGEDGEIQETKIDDTFIVALKYCVMSNQASVSMIQRRFPVGYIKACKIIDWMTNMNYITAPEGSKPRKVLLTKEEFVNIYGDDVDD